MSTFDALMDSTEYLVESGNMSDEDRDELLVFAMREYGEDSFMNIPLTYDDIFEAVDAGVVTEEDAYDLIVDSVLGYDEVTESMLYDPNKEDEDTKKQKEEIEKEKKSKRKKKIRNALIGLGIAGGAAGFAIQHTRVKNSRAHNDKEAQKLYNQVISDHAKALGKANSKEDIAKIDAASREELKKGLVKIYGGNKRSFSGKPKVNYTDEINKADKAAKDLVSTINTLSKKSTLTDDEAKVLQDAPKKLKKLQSLIDKDSAKIKRNYAKNTKATPLLGKIMPGYASKTAFKNNVAADTLTAASIGARKQLKDTGKVNSKKVAKEVNDINKSGRLYGYLAYDGDSKDEHDKAQVGGLFGGHNSSKASTGSDAVDKILND